MSIFQDKHILLGVTGGIAAYKAVELLRLLKKAGARVTVSMTESAQYFVGKTTFQVLSENDVLCELFHTDESTVKHIDIASSSDAVVIAPATANFIGKLANGIADDALTTTLLAVTCPVMVCPSMNSDMYQNIRVQRNLDILEGDGIHILDPDSGELACKTTGAGRLPEPEYIFDRLARLLVPKDLAGKQVLISAGPTMEPIDPVRYISNHSSGKMGYAIARAAEMRGASVTLVSGPVSLDPPFHVNTIPVKTCTEMYDQIMDQLDVADIIIKVAAVADFTPDQASDTKIKKTGTSSSLRIDLKENPDILKDVGRKKRKDQFLVGFAAETHDLIANANAKIEKKNLDMIVANTVGKEGTGFKADTNQASFIGRDGTCETLPLMDKFDLANRLLDRILKSL